MDSENVMVLARLLEELTPARMTLAALFSLIAIIAFKGISLPPLSKQ